MKRRLLTILAAVSVLLCVATCGAWVRSYWVADQFMNETGPGTCRQPGEPTWKREQSIFCSHGGIQVLDRYNEYHVCYGFLIPGRGKCWMTSADTTRLKCSLRKGRKRVSLSARRVQPRCLQ